MTQPRRCKDCPPDGRLRPVVPNYPGPRCATHKRAHRKRMREQAHARRLESNFSFTAEQYAALKDWQGGSCWGCRRANGATKNLAVDHDHNCLADHPPDRGCPECVRALLCGPCNQILGRYDIAALCRLIEVLTDPPAQRFRRGDPPPRL